MKNTTKRVIYTSLTVLIVVFSSTFAILMTLERNDYRNYLQGEYSRSMYELISSIRGIRTNLAKAPIIGSREQGIVVFDEIFRSASLASDKLNSMPIAGENLEQTNKYLSQVGDFCFVLSKNISEGKEITEENIKSIEDLKKVSENLEAKLSETSSEINEGKLKWGEIRKKVTGVLAKGSTKDLSSKFGNMKKQIVQYPTLIYDGPFSDNTLDIKPRINEQTEVSKEEAEKVVVRAVGSDKIESIKYIKDEGKKDISSYRFSIKTKESKQDSVCEVTKNGGKIIYLILNKNLKEPKLDTKKAIEIGSKYLQDIGYKNMVPTYSLKYEDTAVVNYIYKQGDVMVYPDQIKLKIALNDGTVTGIESEKYLVSHVEKRNLPSNIISKNEARKRVGKRLDIKSEKLVIIPTETNKEAFCYEFAGTYNNNNFIVYINAETGYEQRIIQIINTPNGELTI